MQILILGASTRAAAGSALRAGHQPICCDRFADLDLQRIAEVRLVADYPRDLLRVVEEFSQMPWLYTGALENYPNLLRRLEERSPLWGNGYEAVWKVRDPFQLQPLLEEHDLPALEIRPFHTPPPRDGNWVIKPMHTAAGRLIRIWDHSDYELLNEPCWFQQRAEGTSHGAVFLGSDEGCRLLGVTRQCLDSLPAEGQQFVYGGSIGPVTLAAEVTGRIVQFGETLCREAGLRGLFGCDFVVNGQDVWLVEVNPRYVASIEVLELAGQTSLLAEHVRVFGGEEGAPPATAPAQDGNERVVGKQILYAKTKLQISAELTTPEELASLTAHDAAWRVPRIADIPAAGTVIEPAEPVCTVFAEAATETECGALLTAAAEEIQRTLGLA